MSASKTNVRVALGVVALLALGALIVMNTERGDEPQGTRPFTARDAAPPPLDAAKDAPADPLLRVRLDGAVRLHLPPGRVIGEALTDDDLRERRRSQITLLEQRIADAEAELERVPDSTIAQQRLVHLRERRDLLRGLVETE